MHVKLDIHDDNIAHVIFDREGSSANIFDFDAMRELDSHIDAIAANPRITGVIFTSAKDSIFIAGADIKAFLGQDVTEDALEQLVANGQKVFSKIAALKPPTVAAIHGACMGGGLEMCLACDYRIASDEKQTKIGLPETTLGILPGWGGCARLPRLIGLPKALTMILQGKRLAAKQAKKYGLIDQVVPRGHFIRWSKKLIHQGKAKPKSHWKTNNVLSAKFIASKVRPELQKKTRGHYPAMFKALEVTLQGLSLPIEETLLLERKALVELIQTDVSNNLVRVFFMQERAKHLQLEDVSIIKGTPEKDLPPVKDIAVVGAGTMGAGIAQWCSARGSDVILKDVGTEQLAKGMSAIGKVYHSAAKRHVMSRTEARKGLDRIHPTHNDVPMSKIDMVIEAATENMDLKQKIFASLEPMVGENTILATNTSALSIGDLAERTSNPDQVIGVHFFNPVHRMQLVEIVVCAKTSPSTAARTLKYVQKIGKMPVVTKDSPGFAVNRILMPYLTEAGHLFNDGASISDIDESMLDFGMPMGPMRLLDEVGIDVANHVAQFFGSSFGDRMPAPDSLPKMVEKGLLGRKSGNGFYLYGNSKKKKAEPQINTELDAFISSRGATILTRQELQERMVLVMLNEAARCMEEEVVSAPEDIDFAMIMGTGFAPFRGGPLRYTDALGIKHVVNRLEELASRENDRFAPCQVLRSMADNDGCWYPADRKDT